MATQKLTVDQQSELKRLYLEHTSATKLGKQFNISTTTVTRILTDLGVQLRTRSQTQSLFQVEFKQSANYSTYKARLSDRLKGRVFTATTKERMSRSRAEGIASGSINSRTYGKAEWYNGFYCRSTWEVKFVQFCEQTGIKIQSCNLVIPYQFEGKIKNYIPDFIDGERNIYEIKPMSLRDTKLNIAKFQAARQFAIENNYSFKIITEWTLFYKRGFREDYR